MSPFKHAELAVRAWYLGLFVLQVNELVYLNGVCAYLAWPGRADRRGRRTGWAWQIDIMASMRGMDLVGSVDQIDNVAEL